MEQVKLEKFSTVPCIFNEKINEVREDKLKSLKLKLDLELQDYDDYKEEKICKLNYLTWIEFKLRHFPEAKNRNEEVMGLTCNDNVTALLGSAWIALETGNTEEYNTSLSSLETLTAPINCGRDVAIDQSCAQLAYCFLRFGNLDLTKRSLYLYTEIVEKLPNNYFWKVKLGLVHSRIAMTKAFRSFSERSYSTNKALEYYCDVIDNSKNTELIREAYTQIIYLRTSCEKLKLPITSDNKIWQQEFKDLIQETLRVGSDDPYTLSIVAEALRLTGDLDEAIKHLEKSLKLKPISKTFHFLGKCYQEKRDDVISKARHNFEKAIEISLDHNFSAVCDFGKFLMSCDLNDEALEKFRRITGQSSLMVQWDYLHELVTAYEQSAVILLEKAKQESSLKEKAEYYLLQAVNVNCIMKRCQRKSLKHICDLLHRENLEVPRVISSLRYFDFRVNYLRREVKTEFESKNYEFAFTLMTMFESKTKDIPKDLMSKVNCYTAARRLQLRESTVHFITKPLFKQAVESRIQPGSSEKNSTSLAKCIDVLILCDHENPASSERASMLKKHLSEIFGLDVSLRQKCNSMQEIDQSHVVLVLIDSQQPSSSFQDVQKYVAGNCSKVFIGQSGKVQASESLSKFKTFEVDLLPENLDSPPRHREEFSDPVNQWMKLYCSLIGTVWPLCHN